MNSTEILKRLKSGCTLHGSIFGFFIQSPIDSRCTNVHGGAAKSLLRRKLVVRVGDHWEAPSSPPCSCGNPIAYWKGSDRREYACKSCHSASPTLHP